MTAPRLADLPADVRAIVRAALAAERAANHKAGAVDPPAGVLPDGGRVGVMSDPARRRPKAAA
jgi:hypothetical protein